VRVWVGAGFAVLAAAFWLATRTPALPPIEDDRVGVDLGGVRFIAELAADPATQQRGLSGRERIDALGGMLFAYPSPRPLQFVMRDCLVPIDIAFLDRAGRVVAVHAMGVETPRQPWETKRQYEARLPRYTSPPEALFALEVAGGRLAELGVEVASTARFDVAAVLARLQRR
jgi:uncharacterized membrane protein (UPF0127 family)